MLRQRRKNEGAVLLLVIGVITIVSVLGSAILVRTVSNRKMKQEEKSAQTTFSKADGGSQELASELELLAQDAIKKAFSDLLMGYGGAGSNDERMKRFNQVFVTSLQNELDSTDETALQKLLKEALGVDAPIEVSYGSIIVDPDSWTAGSKVTNKITIKDAVFSANDGAGHSAKITTDITVEAVIPDVEKGMSSGVAAAFEDFILITYGGVSSTASGNKTTVDGNVYIAENYVQKNDTSNVFKNANKLLIKGNVDLSDGAEMEVKDTVCSSGTGLWAENIFSDKGSKLTVGSNCYLRDDLNISGTNTSVKLKGEEYLGYSGTVNDGSGTIAPPEKSSAIMINTAENITLDMSELGMLVLRGSSYIKDALWGKNLLTVGSAVNKEANMLGILQGESLAYKEMQAIYLVPAECSFTGKNPMTWDEYKIETSNGTVKKPIGMSCKFVNDRTGETATLNLSDYINSATDYETRFVRMDGGSTVYVYLYLKFKDEAAAAKYQKDYLSTWKGNDIKTQISRLGTGSKILLANKNYTVSNMLSYNDPKSKDPLDMKFADGSTLSLLQSKSRTAERQYGGLFYCLDASMTRNIPENYDLIRSSVLTGDALTKATGTIVTKNGSSFVYKKGNVKVTELPSGFDSGILLVEGNLIVNDSFDFTGLIIVVGTRDAEGNVISGNVELKGSSVNLTADKDIVCSLLEEKKVAEYFRGYASAGAGSGSAGYVSSDSVTIRFENWNRN